MPFFSIGNSLGVTTSFWIFWVVVIVLELVLWIAIMSGITITEKKIGVILGGMATAKKKYERSTKKADQDGQV
jgi:hypothetical protein